MLPEREYPLPAGRGRRLPLRLRRLQRRASVLVALVGKPHPIVPYSLRLRRQVRPRRVCHRQRLVRLHAGRLRLLHEEGTRQPRMMSIGARARVACHRREGARRQPPSPARASRSSWRRSSTRCSEPGHRHQQSADADLYGSASDDLSSSHSVPLTAMRTTNVPRAPMTHIGQCHGRWRRRSRDRLARRGTCATGIGRIAIVRRSRDGYSSPAKPARSTPMARCTAPLRPGSLPPSRSQSSAVAGRRPAGRASTARDPSPHPAPQQRP